MNPVNEMGPVIAAIRVAPVAMSLASKLASALGTSDNVTPAEDNESKIKISKKDSKKSQKIHTGDNKYTSMTEKKNIVNFLLSLNEKNYAQAHKYLKQIMESKLYKRIAKNKGVKLY